MTSEASEAIKVAAKSNAHKHGLAYERPLFGQDCFRGAAKKAVRNLQAKILRCPKPNKRSQRLSEQGFFHATLDHIYLDRRVHIHCIDIMNISHLRTRCAELESCSRSVLAVDDGSCTAAADILL